ncbi:hypothetical protein SteCoe_23908 [Stentor coeruleus]|uniref:Uncharacterized protein n=1 Tax=Stentor coeruleus TaxID=5963 RepID=A0A1R2BB70_9CILI|nr:hypothetical protein SteCoe_27175 [Stentor coeruleus]OMJ76679.1 hypothetical protein SteCoe_23908 [Stentor coeruleus]
MENSNLFVKKPRIIISYFAVLILLRVLPLAFSFWLFQGSGQKKWYGSLTKIYNSKGMIPEKDYTTVSNYYCNMSLNYYQNSTSNNHYLFTPDETDMLCIQFDQLNSGLQAFLAFDIVAIIILLVFCLVYIIGFLYYKKPVLFCLQIISVCGGFFEITCLGILEAVIGPSFVGECDRIGGDFKNGNYINAANICIGNGGFLHIFISMIVMITYAVFGVLWKKLEPKMMINIVKVADEFISREINLHGKNNNLNNHDRVYEEPPLRNDILPGEDNLDNSGRNQDFILPFTIGRESVSISETFNMINNH